MNEAEKALRDTYQSAFNDRVHLAEERAGRVVDKYISDAIASVLGMEWDRWDEIWKVPSNPNELPPVVRDAAVKAINGMDIKVVLSDAEVERIRKAYRRVFISAAVDAAERLAQEQADAIVDRVLGKEEDEA